MPLINRCGGGGGSSTPSIFGDGSDGDVIISSDTTLPVAVPHQSIVEKNYKSLTIESGAVLSCDSWNTGLILRVKGDCTIHGTIDQSGKAPKTNPNNNYPYPAQLVCGNGGNGGNLWRYTATSGGTGMLARPYGGGYGGGGTGGYGGNNGGDGGSSTGITVDVPTIFIGGQPKSTHEVGNPGTFGGGGSGGGTSEYGACAGGNLAGADGGSDGSNGSGGAGGGAGNYGGGVIMLYVGRNLNIDGNIKCNGGNGGNGGVITVGSGDNGAGGGGAGGGAIYICHKGTYTNTGGMQVNGGSGGTGAALGQSGSANGSAGGIGSITVLSYDDLEV
jgi:hypothetical protein